MRTRSSGPFLGPDGAVCLRRAGVDRQVSRPGPHDAQVRVLRHRQRGLPQRLPLRAAACVGGAAGGAAGGRGGKDPRQRRRRPRQPGGCPPPNPSGNAFYPRLSFQAGRDTPATPALRRCSFALPRPTRPLHTSMCPFQTP
eukprot:6161958-Pyramimonas_sp.AAC.1